MNQQKLIYSLDELNKAVELLKSLMPQCKVFTFTGSLGAGKTTLVRALLQKCGVDKDIITSPTFTYVNVYENRRGQTFYHFDLYRIGSLDEFCAAGFDEYLYAPNSWAFIEWPEPVMELLQDRVCHVTINYHGEDKRELVYKVVK